MCRPHTTALLTTAVIATSSFAQSQPEAVFDGLVADGIRVSAPGTTRVTLGGGSGFDGAPALGGISAEYGLVNRVAVRASVRWDYGELSPGAAVRWQLLDQQSAPADLAATVQLRALGMEAAGPQVDARLGLGRSWDRVSASVAVQVGRGLLARQDVDFETAAQVGVRVGGVLRVGAEARLRTELVDVYETEEDHGRPYELIGGPTVSAELGPTVLQVLVGYRAPRGPWAAGAVAMGQLGIAF